MLFKVLMVVLGVGVKLWGSEIDLSGIDWTTANYSAVHMALESKDISGDVRTSACSRLLSLMEEETDVEKLLNSVDMYVTNNSSKKPFAITLLTQKLESILSVKDQEKVKQKLKALNTDKDQIASDSVKGDLFLGLPKSRGFRK